MSSLREAASVAISLNRAGFINKVIYVSTEGLHRNFFIVIDLYSISKLEMLRSGNLVSIFLQTESGRSRLIFIIRNR